MNILWLTNVPLPEATNLLNIKEVNSGGWLIGAYDYLTISRNVKLSILFPVKSDTNTKRKIAGKNIDYFTFPQFKNKAINKNKENRIFEQVIDETKPDVVHIFGTELPHSLVMLN